MKYKLCGWWWRWQACKMAASVLSNRNHEDDRSLAPICWSLAVFFERYMMFGAAETSEEFGPKEPVSLQTASKQTALVERK